ncbi:methionyl-tRNA formyltransferase [Sphingomonas sinipercae]|uniref:Methionyl-tRNA formyltransferase n=1 Tax=Sphingomonas sinipercae TaxID=2714944 RepID=A0A6G7ZMR9_9SPHN|nr:methionyl-tRNA formyltransferase [Sphingomonas sinipercae]QIL02233.1 methionyl-tRNA formyltransferase [Sphingomonas sinipercae]
MRIVFMGSPDFAVPSLDALVAAGHEVTCVYTQPPRPAGRGKGERKTAVHERAEALGIEVRCPKSLRNEEEQARFAALEAELAVVAAYGLILPKAVLDAPRDGCVNVHASLLPRWRGAAPIQRSILAGDAETGVTIMQMEEGLDTGPMLLKRETPVDGKTAGELTGELARIGAAALVAWLDDPAPGETQPEDGVTYAKKIDKAEARIEWSRSAEEIERQVRAFAPSPGAWFEANGDRVKLLAAAVGQDASGTPGEVLDECLNVACGSGYIRPLKVQRAGKGAMTAGELLRGFAIPKGTMLP